MGVISLVGRGKNRKLRDQVSRIFRPVEKAEPKDVFSPQQKATDFYVIDFNKNGGYDRGRDGVLIFDMNGDGRYDDSDVRQTSEMMRAAAGEIDFNKDGVVDQFERARAKQHLRAFRNRDFNGDGKLDREELNLNFARVWVDRDGDGRVGFFEDSHPNEVRAGDFLVSGSKKYPKLSQQTYQVDWVAPRSQESSLSNASLDTFRDKRFERFRRRLKYLTPSTNDHQGLQYAGYPR